MKINSAHIIQSVLSGLGIGFPVTLVCMTAIGGFNDVTREFLVWMVASALFGLLSGILLHSSIDLPLPASMGLHCLGCFCVTVAAATIIGYADSFGALITSILPAFIVVYVMIYAVCYAIMKHQEKKINEALNRQ